KVATEAPMRGVEKLRDALRAQQRLGETGDEASAIAYQRGFFGQQGADGPQVAAGKRLHEFVQQAVVGFRVYREAWLFFAQLRSGAAYELSAGTLRFAQNLRNLGVVCVEYLAQQKCGTRLGAQLLKQRQV